VVKLDIRRAGVVVDQANGLPDHKRHGLGFCFTHSLRSDRSAFAAMQEFVSRFMDKRGEGFRLRLSGQERDASAVAHAECGGNVGVIDKLNPLGLHEGRQSVDVLARVACDFVECGQLYTIGLRNIEDVSITEAE
jgi:hypothetical protein